MTRAMFLAWVALPALVPTNAAAQSAAGVPAAPTPEIAADLPQTPVEVSAVKENGLFRLRTTEISLALYTYDQDAEDRSACVGT